MSTETGNLVVDRGAVISEDGAYRYRLWRTWDPSLPKMVWIMLNPSTADANVDDPTIRRCVGFARREHCGGIEVINLYAYRATNPRSLLDAAFPEGPENCAAWADALSVHTGPVVAAWGAHGPSLLDMWQDPQITGLPRSEAFRQEHPGGMWHLGTTKSGAPRHPLMVRADEPFTRNWICGDPLRGEGDTAAAWCRT